MLRWVFYGALAALLTRLLNSGIFAAMILLAEIFVIGTFAGMTDGILGTIAAFMPQPNTQILVHGSELMQGINHCKPAAALALALILIIAGAGAGWVVRRKALV